MSVLHEFIHIIKLHPKLLTLSHLSFLLAERCSQTKIAKFSFSSSSYTAVAMPMLYNTRYSSRRRVTVMISVVWVLSFAISCPLLFGLNNTGKRETHLLPNRCAFYSVTKLVEQHWGCTELFMSNSSAHHSTFYITNTHIIVHYRLSANAS